MSGMSIPSRQEMFDRAFVGLRSQGFKQAKARCGAKCAYLDVTTGFRCAWGWVDTALTYQVEPVRSLSRGIATTLSPADLNWAMELQDCHDSANSPGEMKRLLLSHAAFYDLTVPEDVK